MPAGTEQALVEHGCSSAQMLPGMPGVGKVGNGGEEEAFWGGESVGRMHAGGGSRIGGGCTSGAQIHWILSLHMDPDLVWRLLILATP